MTSVEKRRSSRKSGGHCKHSDGGFSDASSGGSFLDETDREVSNLTDRAFRSLCVGEEAVYNDSDLSLSSPSIQRDRQLAFNQGRDIEERDREERKRAACENFSLRVQQYEQDWILGGMYGAEIHGDPQWQVYGERTQGMVSATFQHSLVDTSQQGKSLREGELSFFSNGATDLSSSQQRRSHSRVSSLVQAFNSEGHTDGARTDNNLREWSDGTSWDRSALMSIQRELSEFSTSYQQNFDSHHFPSASLFSPQDTSFCSPHVGAMPQMSHNSESSYMRSSQVKHNMSAQVSCNSNFFIHSEFSPFKLWRDHNRFPFQQGNISGFMQRSEFPKWYETPMYKELSLENQSHGPYRDLRHPRNNLGLTAPPTRSTSTSTMLQKTSAMEKRCESELAGHYPHRKWTESLGTNKLPSQRPSTASPTTEMSRRVRDTISSVKALQQKIKMMSEQNMTTDVMANQMNQGVGIYGNDNWINRGNNAVTLGPNVVSTGQLLTPSIHAHRETEMLRFQQHGVSPQPVEHPPVRAESRGATPDIRTSSYKSRATSLLFNLKDNRKRVKSTYSPTKFKGLENQEKNKQRLMQESCEPVTNIHGFTGSDTQLLQQQDPRRTAVNQFNSPGLSLTTQNGQSKRANLNQYPEIMPGDYQTAHTQGQMVHHTGLSGFIPENYTNNQLANGQNPHENLASFTPCRQDCPGSMEQLQQSYSATDTARLNTENSESREYLISQTNSEQAFNETVGRVFSKVERYEQMKENKQNYKNVSSQDTWMQTNSQESDSFSLKTAMSQSKQGTASLTERSREENQSSRNKELQKVELRESLAYGTSFKKADAVSTKQQEGQQMKEDKNGSLTQNYNKYTDQDHRNQHSIYPTTDKHVTMQKTSPIKQNLPVLKEYGKPSQQQIEAKLQGEIPENTPAPTHPIKDRPSVESKDEEVTTRGKGQNYKADETKAQRMAQVEQPTAESVGFIPAEKTGSDHFKTEESNLDPTILECLGQAKGEQIKEEKTKGEPEEKFRVQKELEQDGAKQTRVQQLTDEPNNITEKDDHEHLREEPVEAEHAETEKLREEHIKTKLEKTEEAGMARTQQAKVEEATAKRINLEQAERKQLKTEQAVDKKMEGEQIKSENPKTEQADAEDKKAEQTKHMKATEIEAMEAETEHMKGEMVRQVKVEKDSTHVGKRNLDKSTTLAKDTKLKETNAQQTKSEENQLDQSKAGLPTEPSNLTETSAKLTVAQPVRKEPDRVEQVKSELAKAKAELAKIKEKMRGEQKEKVKINPIIKEDGTSKDHIPVMINIEENKDSKKQEESVDYERLREKYGYANTNSNQTTAQGSLTLHDPNKTEVLSLKESGAENNEKSKNEPSLANTENKEDVSSFTHSEVTSSEKSKELKLSNINSVPTYLCNKANGDNIVDKLKDDSGHKLEKCDAVKNTVSQQRDSNLAKLIPPERKPESKEQNAGASTDLPVTSSRALLHKDRTQTKQEILTSKIKAHAEKEISAIKEKGLALRDGFIGKSSAKHLASGVNIRQRPPSKEVLKKHEALNNFPLKHQMELSEVQKEPAKFAPVPSSATVTVKSETTSTQLVEHLTNPAEPIHSASSTMSITESKIQKEVGIMSKVQSKEQAKTKDNQEKEQTNHTDISGRQKEELQQEKSFEILSESKADQTQATGVKAANPKHLTTAKDETKEVANQDSESLNEQKQAAVTEDSLEIVGIMVTIRERGPNVDTDQGNNSTGKQRNTAEKECNKSEEDESHPRQGHKENTASKESSLIKAKDEMKSPSVVKDDSSKVKENNNPDNVQETLILEEKMKDMMENAAAKRTNLQQKSTANIESRGEPEPEPVTAHANGKLLTDTQTVLFRQNTNVKEAKNFVTKSVKENLVQGTEEMTRDKETNQQQMQTAHMNKKTTVSNSEIDHKSESSIKEPLVKDLSVVKSSKSRNIDGQSAPLPEEKVFASTGPKPFNAGPSKNSAENEKLPFYQKQSKEANQDVNVHIESIAIRVVSSATEEENISDEHRLKSFPSASGEQKMEESLEDKLAVQYVLSSVRKLSDSLKASGKQNSTNANSESNKSEPGKPDFNVLPVEGDYFQVQGVTETDNRSHSSLTTAEDKLKETELPTLLPNETSNELSVDRKNEAFVFRLDEREKKSSDENIKKTNQETEDTLSSTQTDGSMERQVNTEKREAGQFNHIKKHHKENLSNLSAMERQSSRDSRSKTLNPVPEKSEPKPKPKGRTSTIPEISAIADYARLKVIVSEDKEETAPKEFPPNKKEGFFPLIQTRHSRRPVFTDDLQDLSVKDKKLPNRMEMTAKVNKEPKALVFPITEKGHQRTGMFKLGDKQRPEQVVLGANMNAGLKNNVGTNPSHNETNTSPTAQTGTKKLDPSTGQPTNQDTAPSSASNRVNNSSEELTYLDENLLLRANLGEMHHRKENTSHPEKQESPENQKDKHTRTGAEDRRTDKFKNESLTNQHEEIKSKQQGQKQQSEEEKVFRCEKKQGEEDRRIKHMLEESRASLAEEERDATRREEERRAKERQAVNIMIKERREKHRQLDTRAGEEIKHKQREDRRIVQKGEEVHTKQNVDPITENGEKRGIKIEDENRAKLREEENKRLKQQGKEKTANVGQQRRIAEEEQTKAERRLVQEEQMRKSAHEEQQRRTAEEEVQRKAAEEKKQETGDRTRKAAHEEHQRIAEGQRTVAQVEQQRRIVQEEQKRKSAHEEQQRRATQGEKQQRAAQEQQRRVIHMEQQGRTAEEEQRRAAQMEQQWRKSAHEEQRRRAAEEEQQQRAAQEEQQRKAVREEQQRREAQVEQQRKTAQMEQQKRAAQQEQQKRAAEIEQQHRAAQEEQQQRAAEVEQQRRAAEIEQQHRAAEIEQQRRAAEIEQQHRAAEIEQQRRAAYMEKQKRAAEEEQLQRAAHKEQQRITVQREQQKRAAQQEQQQRAAEIEQQQRAAQEEQQRTAAKIEQQQRVVQEEQQRRATEKQRRVSQVEQQTKVAYEEEARNPAEKEQRSVAQIEQQRRLTQEVQLRKSAHEEQHRKYVQGEKQRRDLQHLQEVQQKRAAHEEQQREVEEHQKKAVQEKQQRRAAQLEEQKQINDMIADDILEEWKRKPNEDKRTGLLPGEQIIKQIQEQKAEELRKERSTKEQWIKPQKEDGEDNRIAENEETMKQVEKQAKLEDAVLIEKNTEAQELRLTKREIDMHDDKRKEEDEKSAVHREKAKAIQTEKQTKEAPRLDVLQYYAITSTNTEKKPRERQLSSPVPSQPTHNQLVIESSDDSTYHTRPHRPHAAASPASSLPRSNTSSPALGGKPLMFRVKNNTIRGSSLTKSIKPRFHKNFGEDFWMGSPSDRTEDEQEIIRRSAGTPVHPDKGVNQFSAMSESSTLLSASSLQDYSTSISRQRPYSRRSMALDDDESRSVISNMSEDVESFATNATDVADVRGLFDYERPDSACSFSSDVSRSLGKPPVVPPKSEKALRRAQRLTSRRIKKELSKAAAGSPAGVEEKVSSFPSSTEVCSSSNYAVASPHFSPPITFAHAPSLGSSLPSSHTEHQPTHHSFHASPHATGPISLPISSPHVSSTVSLPSVSHHASVPTSKPAAPKIVAHVSSSSTPHLINTHSTPVTQYHVEPSHYHQSYPLTQHKVLQDLGSGQYFVVEVPVQVKSKTFFDPETGKYVQLNVRQSGQNISQPQPQQMYPQPQLQPQMQIKSQQLSQGSLTGKPFVFYPAYQGYPQSHQPAVINSLHSNRLSAPATLHQDQQPPREASTEVQQTSEERRYSPEKTPYMDTVNDTNRTYNPINSTQDSYETNSQLVGSSVCENDNSANSLCQSRDIIAISELEDFMEVSDW